MEKPYPWMKVSYVNVVYGKRTHRVHNEKRDHGTYITLLGICENQVSKVLRIKNLSKKRHFLIKFQILRFLTSWTHKTLRLHLEPLKIKFRVLLLVQRARHFQKISQKVQMWIGWDSTPRMHLQSGYFLMYCKKYITCRW